MGGSYGLLNTSTLAPRPDLYALLLWRKLMGDRVLGARAATPGGGAELAHLRAYAHCTPTLGASQGEVTLLLINLHAAKSYQVRLRSARSPSSVEVVEEYVVSSDALGSQQVALNGEWLRAAPDGALPQLLPRRNARRADSTDRLVRHHVVVAPHSYGFFVLRGAAAATCVDMREP